MMVNIVTEHHEHRLASGRETSMTCMASNTATTSNLPFAIEAPDGQ